MEAEVEVSAMIANLVVMLGLFTVGWGLVALLMVTRVKNLQVGQARAFVGRRARFSGRPATEQDRRFMKRLAQVFIVLGAAASVGGLVWDFLSA